MTNKTKNEGITITTEEAIIANTDAISFVSSLKNGSVDAFVTDPPYAISRDTNFQSGDTTGRDTDRFRVSLDFGEWDTVDQDYFMALFSEMYKKLRKGGTVVMFYDLWKIQELKLWLESAGFSMFRMIEWVKTNPVPINRKRLYLSNSREVAIVCVKGGKPTYNMHWLKTNEKGESAYGNQDKGIFNYPIAHRKGRFHPTEKPEELIRELIEIHSNPGDVIVDPFLGSGTTAVAAKACGRAFGGCELSTEYFPKILARLAE